jgi:hypothetical protein
MAGIKFSLSIHATLHGMLTQILTVYLQTKFPVTGVTNLELIIIIIIIIIIIALSLIAITWHVVVEERKVFISFLSLSLAISYHPLLDLIPHILSAKAEAKCNFEGNINVTAL